MPRLRDTRTGVVVEVDEATATALGVAYEPAEQPAASPKAAGRSTVKASAPKPSSD